MGIPVIDQHIDGINIANCFCCSVFISVVLIALLQKKEHTATVRHFILFAFFSATATWMDVISYLSAGNALFRGLSYVVNAGTYLFSALAACAFFIYIIAYFEERAHKTYTPVLRKAAYVYTALCSVLYISSIWTHTFFYLDAENRYIETPLTFVTGVVIIPLVVAGIAVILKNRKSTTTGDTVIHLLYNIAYLALGLLDTLLTTTFHYIVMAVFVVVIYIFINQQRDEVLKTKQKELAVSELNALRLQMNPHYIYNTLASIDGLVMTEPKEARGLIAKFTKHLRAGYLDDNPRVVPFEKELENIRCYLAVEEVRFPHIRVEYAIETTDFTLPPLTVQPLVENAIKHGICKKNDSAGKIDIATVETEDSYCIIVRDDGVGFDPTAPKPHDGRSHIGLENARKRLELICGGSLEITGEIGVGVEAVVKIPKESV